jgi:nitrate/nitrite transporter NarK
VLLTDRLGRIRLQILGFIGCAVGLLLAALSLYVGGTLSGVLLFAGFMVFSFMTNIGPNAMTYLIAGEVFPTSIRGAGAGFAASFAKIGAVLTAFLFPILLKDIGTDLLLLILVGTQPCRRARHLALRHRNQGHQPGKYRRQGDRGARGGRMMAGVPLTAYCRPRIARASSGVATTSPRTSTILTAFSTSAALLGASLPFSR